LHGKIIIIMAERNAHSLRSIFERDLPKQVGKEVSLPDGTGYTISGVYGKAGLMHTASETGNWFIYWHNDKDPSILIANGGKTGFSDIFVVRRQMIHIIDRYLGAKVEIDPELWEAEESEGKQLTFEGLANYLGRNLDKQRQLEIAENYIIPGEQNLITDWISLLQKTNRDIPQIDGAGRLNIVREQIEDLVINLKPATNRYKRSARLYLEEGLKRDAPELLGSVIKAQVELLQRSQQIVGKTEGIMARLNDLDIVQLSWNGLIAHIPGTLAHIALAMDPEYDEVRRQRAMGSFFSPNAGIFQKLGELRGEPYYSRAQIYLKALAPIQQAWQKGDRGRVKSLIDKQIPSMKEWYREVREQTTGIQFNRFATV
jgi:hypothetical protein